MTLKQYLMPIGAADLTETDWRTMNKQYRLCGYNFVVAAPLAELLMLRTCLELFRHLLAAHLLLSGESWEKEQQAADISFRLGKAGAEPRQYRACIAAKGCLEAEFEIFRWEGNGSIYPPTSALSMYNTSSSRSCLDWAAQRKNTCSCPTSNSQRTCFLLLEDTDLGEVFVKTWLANEKVHAR